MVELHSKHSSSSYSFFSTEHGFFATAGRGSFPNLVEGQKQGGSKHPSDTVLRDPHTT